LRDFDIRHVNGEQSRSWVKFASRLTIQTLCGALDMAWQTVEIDKAAFKVDGAAHAREVLAKQIVELAKLGERDPQRLANGALARFKL
jgi:hypothetical protein